MTMPHAKKLVLLDYCLNHWAIASGVMVFLTGTGMDTFIFTWDDQIQGKISAVFPGRFDELEFSDGTRDILLDFKLTGSQTYYYPKKGDTISKSRHSFVYYINGKASTDCASEIARSFPPPVLVIASSVYLTLEWFLFRKEQLPVLLLILSRYALPDSLQGTVEEFRSFLGKRRFGFLISLSMSVLFLVAATVFLFLFFYAVTTREFPASYS